MPQPVLMEIDDGVAILSLNRPEVRNAIDREVTLAVAAAVDEIDSRPDVQVTILTGRGGTFSSGMDLRAYVRGEDVTIEGRGLLGITTRPPRKPLIAAVEGWALAGGCEVALACDLIVAADDATFGIPEVKRGLAASGGGLLRLPRMIPRAIAMEMALTGDPLPARRAHELGLVNALTPHGGALEEALRLARRIAVNAPLGLWASTNILRTAGDERYLVEFAAQDEYMSVVFASQDAREGATAFNEKRPPRWQGR